jgi:hypothetical protein
MKPIYILYGLLIGLAPLAIGILGSTVDPHGWPSVLPWITMLTLPAGVFLGVLLALFS